MKVSGFSLFGCLCLCSADGASGWQSVPLFGSRCLCSADGAPAHATRGGDGRQEGRERGYYHLHRNLNNTLFPHNHSLLIVHCALCIEHCALSIVNCALCIVH